MGEIKFRGKDSVSGEWRYGFYLEMTLDRKAYIKEPDEHGRHFIGYMIERETVGQYTGLKDADGNKVYEGDVQDIECYTGGNLPDKWRCVVKWDAILARWIWHEIEFKIIICPDEILYKKTIGNIHDNPELSRGENEKNQS